LFLGCVWKIFSWKSSFFRYEFSEEGKSRKENPILELLRKGNIIAVGSTSIIRSEYSSS